MFRVVRQPVVPTSIFMVWLVRVVAILSLVPAFFLTWFLSGSDDSPRNRVAPVLGLGVLASTVWLVVTAFQLPDSSTPIEVAAALPLVIGLAAWPFSGSRASGRPAWREYVPSAMVLAAPLVAAILYLTP